MASSDITSNSFYDLLLELPHYVGKPTSFDVAVSYKGQAIPFIGASGTASFKFEEKLKGIRFASGLLEIDGDGEGTFQTGAIYRCIFFVPSRGTVSILGTAATSTLVTCNVSGIESTLRTINTEVVVEADDTKEKIAFSPGFDGAVSIDTCADGVKSNAETDVDCGGRYCDLCALGKACGTSKDCEGELICPKGTCVVPDRDGDGQTETEGDCDDSNALRFKGATELVDDGQDTDCDNSTLHGAFSFDTLRKNPATKRFEFDGGATISSDISSAFADFKTPVQLYFAGDVTFSSGGAIRLNGGQGEGAQNDYKIRQPGKAAPTAFGFEGGHGQQCCGGRSGDTSRPSMYSGKGPFNHIGAGWSTHYGSYGSGGGGAGHAEGGSRGRSGSHSGGQPGGAYGNSNSPSAGKDWIDERLEVGSGGGGGSAGGAANQDGSGGGGAGGAILIWAAGRLTVESGARIETKGGAGGNCNRQRHGSSGGGGSGGTIWLYAGTSIQIDGTVSSAGGNGGNQCHGYSQGAAGGNGAAGRVFFQSPGTISGSSSPSATKFSSKWTPVE